MTSTTNNNSDIWRERNVLPQKISNNNNVIWRKSKEFPQKMPANKISTISNTATVGFPMNKNNHSQIKLPLPIDATKTKSITLLQPSLQAGLQNILDCKSQKSVIKQINIAHTGTPHSTMITSMLKNNPAAATALNISNDILKSSNNNVMDNRSCRLKKTLQHLNNDRTKSSSFDLKSPQSQHVLEQTRPNSVRLRPQDVMISKRKQVIKRAQSCSLSKNPVLDKTHPSARRSESMSVKQSLSHPIKLTRQNMYRLNMSKKNALPSKDKHHIISTHKTHAQGQHCIKSPLQKHVRNPSRVFQAISKQEDLPPPRPPAPEPPEMSPFNSLTRYTQMSTAFNSEYPSPKISNHLPLHRIGGSTEVTTNQNDYQTDTQDYNSIKVNHNNHLPLDDINDRIQIAANHNVEMSTAFNVVQTSLGICNENPRQTLHIDGSTRNTSNPNVFLPNLTGGSTTDKNHSANISTPAIGKFITSVYMYLIHNHY